MTLEGFKMFIRHILEVIWYWVWESWHGESTAQTQTRRIFNPYAPVFHVRGIPIPLWLVLLVALIILGFAVIPLINIGFISYPLMMLNVQEHNLTLVTTCSAKSISGRLYIAWDCFALPQLSSMAKAIITVLLIYFAGFFSGVTYAKSKEKER